MTVEWSAYAQSLLGEARQGHAHGPRHDPRVVVRARRPAARRHRSSGRARPPRRDRRPRGRGYPASSRSTSPPCASSCRSRSPTSRRTSTGRSARSGSRPRAPLPRRRCTRTSATRSSAWSSTRSATSMPTSPRSRPRAAAWRSWTTSRRHGFDHGIGPGVYDIHSPRVPSVAGGAVDSSSAPSPRSRPALWVNPDCGLKTRGYDETVASLENIIEATRAVRAGLAVPANAG